MSTTELPGPQHASGRETQSLVGTDAWLRAAGRAKLLAWASLAWMSVEGFAGIVAGLHAHSLGVVTWAASSFVEAVAALIVVWRFSGRRDPLGHQRGTGATLGSRQLLCARALLRRRGDPQAHQRG